jgi:ethanolamine transporter
MAERMGINEVAAVSLLMTCATSLAILPLYPRMDPKGKEIAAAVSLSGAYVFGGSMAFVSNVTDGATVALFVFVKILCAVLSGLIVHSLYSKKTAAEEGGSL